MTEVREWIQLLESCFNEPNSATENVLLGVLTAVLRRAEAEQSGEATARIEELLIEAMNIRKAIKIRSNMQACRVKRSEVAAKVDQMIAERPLKRPGK